MPKKFTSDQFGEELNARAQTGRELGHEAQYVSDQMSRQSRTDAPPSQEGQQVVNDALNARLNAGVPGGLRRVAEQGRTGFNELRDTQKNIIGNAMPGIQGVVHGGFANAGGRIASGGEQAKDTLAEGYGQARGGLTGAYTASRGARTSATGSAISGLGAGGQRAGAASDLGTRMGGVGDTIEEGFAGARNDLDLLGTARQQVSAGGEAGIAQTKQTLRNALDVYGGAAATGNKATQSAFMSAQDRLSGQPGYSELGAGYGGAETELRGREGLSDLTGGYGSAREALYDPSGQAAGAQELEAGAGRARGVYKEPGFRGSLAEAQSYFDTPETRLAVGEFGRRAGGFGGMTPQEIEATKAGVREEFGTAGRELSRLAGERYAGYAPGMETEMLGEGFAKLGASRAGQIRDIDLAANRERRAEQERAAGQLLEFPSRRAGIAVTGAGLEAGETAQRAGLEERLGAGGAELESGASKGLAGLFQSEATQTANLKQDVSKSLANLSSTAGAEKSKYLIENAVRQGRLSVEEADRLTAIADRTAERVGRAEMENGERISNDIIQTAMANAQITEEQAKLLSSMRIDEAVKVGAIDRETALTMFEESVDRADQQRALELEQGKYLSDSFLNEAVALGEMDIQSANAISSLMQRVSTDLAGLTVQEAMQQGQLQQDEMEMLMALEESTTTNLLNMDMFEVMNIMNYELKQQAMALEVSEARKNRRDAMGRAIIGAVAQVGAAAI